MSRARFVLTLDLEAVAAAAENADVTGLGADGETEHEITSASCEFVDGEVVVDIEWERVSGKFAPRDEVIEAIKAALSEEDIVESADEVPIPRRKR